MMHYQFKDIEAYWQKRWALEGTYTVQENQNKPKYYVLDMFPYPSGAGLHVGHPLGYIASDIIARYKVHQGFEVLHPMGYDSFGLPAEQYAIQTGQHPAITTAENIARYRAQLERMGFNYDWGREVRTSDRSKMRISLFTFSLPSSPINSNLNEPLEGLGNKLCSVNVEADEILHLLTTFSQTL